MLASTQRLRHSRDITRVHSKGKPARSGPLQARALRNNRSTSRAVVVVGKKVSKKAVVRNLIRRRLAAVLATQWETVTPGYDIVVTVRDDISAATTAEQTAWLTALITNLELS